MDAKTRKISSLGLLVTLGIVFGDIGTSPLYVMKAIC
ncbi:MAG: KUP/HAK/KT family potassium transporter, partial [Duncaniella sp.]|nr:KUP/HAK/KT family potassium transporter [Duncaniella sp.]